MGNSKRKTESFIERVLLALDSSFRELVLERRRTNDTLVLWKDGKVCHIPVPALEKTRRRMQDVSLDL